MCEVHVCVCAFKCKNVDNFVYKWWKVIRMLVLVIKFSHCYYVAFYIMVHSTCIYAV